MSDFEHRALSLREDKPLIYTAMSKHLYYYRMFVSAFVYKAGGVPLNPFMISGYFLGDMVQRDVIREANNTVVKRSDEVWVFGPVSDGVLAEVQIAKELEKPVKYFKTDKELGISEISKDEVEMEREVAEFRGRL